MICVGPALLIRLLYQRMEHLVVGFAGGGVVFKILPPAAGFDVVGIGNAMRQRIHNDKAMTCIIFTEMDQPALVLVFDHHRICLLYTSPL